MGERTFLSIDEFRSRAKAGEFVSGKDAGLGVQVALAASAAIDVEKREATYDISDATIDRSKDILNPDGGSFSNFTRNPVFLWAHDYSLLPIGKCVKGPWVEDGKVKATFRYHDSSKSPLAEMIWQQVLDGTLRAVSIGFVPQKWAFNEDRGMGIDFDEWELIEVSQVPVPCNPNALLDDGKGIAALEAFVKSLRAQRATQTQEPTVADKQIVTLTVEIPADKDAKAIEAELVKKAKNLGGTIGEKSASTANDDAKDDDLHAQMGSHVKAMGEHCAALAGLKKDYSAAVGEAQAHAKAMGAMVDAMGSMLSGDDAKGFADLLAKTMKADDAEGKGGGAHKLSASQFKRIKSIHKAAGDAMAAHHSSGGATNGEPDTNGDGDGKGKAVEPAPALVDPVRAAFEAEAKSKGISVEALIDEKVQRAVNQAQGRLD